MKGGHSASGRPPDPGALRRDRDGDSWVTLPAEGRDGDLPEWPLDGQTAREAVFWEREWKRPQAVMWELNDQATEVAMYVRALAVAERLDATVASRTLVRQHLEALGISVPGLARNRWKIGTASKAPGRRAGVPSVRGRLKVVAGGAA